MGAATILLFRAFFKMLRDEEEEIKGGKKLRTVRQSLIAGLALIITAFIGLMLLPVMDYLGVVLSKLAGS